MGTSLSLLAMHRSMDLSEQLREAAVTVAAAPIPPASHPWHAARHEALQLGETYKALRQQIGYNSKEVNEAFDTFIVASKHEHALWKTWLREYRAAIA